jgi:hypothetical protein
VIATKGYIGSSHEFGADYNGAMRPIRSRSFFYRAVPHLEAGLDTRLPACARAPRIFLALARRPLPFFVATLMPAFAQRPLAGDHDVCQPSVDTYHSNACAVADGYAAALLLVAVWTQL